MVKDDEISEYDRMVRLSVKNIHAEVRIKIIYVNKWKVLFT